MQLINDCSFWLFTITIMEKALLAKGHRLEVTIKIFVDGDACPVKEEIYKVAIRYQIPVIIVANKRMSIPLHPLISLEVVHDGADAADDWIADQIEANDICITSDIPLADRCLKKMALVIDARGEEFDEDMIGDALATRELMKHLRELGEFKGGPAPFEKKDRSRFLGTLDRVIQRIKHRGGRVN